MDDLERNKQAVLAFYDLMFNQGRPRDAIADGKAGFIEHFERWRANTRDIQTSPPSTYSG